MKIILNLKVRRRGKLTGKVGRRKIYPPVPPPYCLCCLFSQRVASYPSMYARPCESCYSVHQGAGTLRCEEYLTLRIFALAGSLNMSFSSNVLGQVLWNATRMMNRKIKRGIILPYSMRFCRASAQ